jgi:hypothetical protein
VFSVSIRLRHNANLNNCRWSSAKTANTIYTALYKSELIAWAQYLMTGPRRGWKYYIFKSRLYLFTHTHVWLEAAAKTFSSFQPPQENDNLSCYYYYIRPTILHFKCGRGEIISLWSDELRPSPDITANTHTYTWIVKNIYKIYHPAGYKYIIHTFNNIV